MAKKQDNLMPVLAHILGIFTWIFGALIIMLVADEERVKKHAKAALNWQISLTIYSIVAAILMIVLIGFLLVPLLVVLNIVFCIMAAIKASEGTIWKYPVTIGFFK